MEVKSNKEGVKIETVKPTTVEQSTSENVSAETNAPEPATVNQVSTSEQW